jgi:hypothetical protein
MIIAVAREIVMACRAIGAGTIREEDIGGEGTLVVDGKGEPAVIIDTKRDGKTGTITAINA